jgi:hypothetical protein
LVIDTGLLKAAPFGENIDFEVLKGSFYLLVEFIVYSFVNVESVVIILVELNPVLAKFYLFDIGDK